MGITSPQVKQIATDELDTLLKTGGGCNSAQVRQAISGGNEAFASYMKYLAEIADLVQKNPGRNIFK